MSELSRRPYKIGPRLDKYNEAIAAERRKLEALRVEVAEERRKMEEVSGANRSLRERAERIGPATQAVLDIIDYCDGKLTYVAFLGAGVYYNAEVLSVAEARSRHVKGDPLEIRVRASWGSASLEFVSKTRDGSSGEARGLVFLGTSEEDALSKVEKHLRTAPFSWGETKATRAKRLQAFGIPLKAEEAAAIREETVTALRKQLVEAQRSADNANSYLASLKKNIEALEAPAEAAP
jgi:uncharacterized coiled-coil protein SlyX